MRPTSPSSRIRERGFTLLEMLVVLVLAGFLTAAVSLALPSTAGISAKRALAVFVSEIRMARNTAIRTGEIVDFEVHVADSAFRSDSTEKSLPADIVLSVTSAQELKNGEWSVIRFFPDGASSGARLTITRGEDRDTVIVNWLTGRIEYEQ